MMRSHYFQFSIRAMLLVVFCGAIGSYIGMVRAREIHFTDMDGLDYVCSSRREVIGEISRMVTKFKRTLNAAENIDSTAGRLTKLANYIHFVADEHEFFAVMGPSSPDADDFDWPVGFDWRLVGENNGRYQFALYIKWPEAAGTPSMRAYLQTFPILTYAIRMKTEVVYELSPGNGVFKSDPAPIVTIIKSAALCMTAGIIILLVCRMIVVVSNRGKSPAAPMP